MSLQFIQTIKTRWLKVNWSDVCFNVLYKISLYSLYNKTYYPTQQMRKQVILIMEGSAYPFGQADESAASKSKVDARILVRKKHETRSLQQRNQLLDKIHIIKGVQSPHLMKIQTVLEEENSIHLLYEYVPNSLLKYMKNLSDQEIQKLRDHLLDLAANLADTGFVVQWDIKNVGVNDKKEAKYYLDLDRTTLDKSIPRQILQREHLKTVMGIFSVYILNNKTNQKQGATNPKKKQITYEIPKLNARPSQSIESNADPKNLKILPAAASQQKNIQAPSELLKNKQGPKPVPQKPKTPLRKSRTNWKQIEHNEEFMQDFMNVLDDKSENAQSKYVSDEQAEESGQARQNDEYANNDNEGEDDEEIVWVSAPDGHNQERQEQQAENRGEDEEEQIVWVDYRDFRDIKQRVSAAIQRSNQVLEVFKSILARQK